jgi:hypothetical protein
MISEVNSSVKVFGMELKIFISRRKKPNLNFSLMNKMPLRRVSRLDKLIFFNYRRVCEIGQVKTNTSPSRLLPMEVSR